MRPEKKQRIECDCAQFPPLHLKDLAFKLFSLTVLSHINKLIHNVLCFHILRPIIFYSNRGIKYFIAKV